MDELRAKLVEIVALYEERRLKTYEGYQNQWRTSERDVFASIITGLNIAIGWVDEFNIKPCGHEETGWIGFSGYAFCNLCRTVVPEGEK